jgi:hypothetical protein
MKSIVFVAVAVIGAAGLVTSDTSKAQPGTSHPGRLEPEEFCGTGATPRSTANATRCCRLAIVGIHGDQTSLEAARAAAKK